MSTRRFSLTAEQERRLQMELRESGNVQAYRRAAALLAAHQGRAVREVAALLGVTRQTIYNWLSAYGALLDGVSLQDAPRSGRPSLWAGDLDRVVEEALQPFGVGRDGPGIRWTAPLLQEHIASRSGKRFSGETVRRQLRRLGYSWRRGRYVRRPEPSIAAPAPA